MIHTNVTSNEQHRSLRASYVSERLEDLTARCKTDITQRGHEGTVKTRAARLELLEHRAMRPVIFEAITVNQLQDYMKWFKQVKAFVDVFDIPALKSATRSAYDDITRLFGSSSGLDGWMNRVKQIFSSGSNDEEVLNRVNHFLWGVTTSLSTLPTLLSALDQQLDGALTTDADDTSTTLRAALEKHEGTNSAAVMKKFVSFIEGSFKQAVANFGAKQVPYVNAKKVAEEVLNFSIDDINRLSEKATALKNQWETERQELEKAATAIHGASKRDDVETLIRPQSQTDTTAAATTGDTTQVGTQVDPAARRVHLKLPPGMKRNVTLDEKSIESFTEKITTKLLEIGDVVEKGEKLDDATTAALTKFVMTAEFLFRQTAKSAGQSEPQASKTSKQGKKSAGKKSGGK